jgi:regulatory protein
LRQRRAASAAPEGAGPKRPARSLKARAIALLARRDYSRAELRRKLGAPRRDAEDSFAAEVASTHEALEALLDELAQLGYLSDERYARSVVARKSASHSRRAIAEELKTRGVAGDVVSDALGTSEADDGATMRALWQRRFGTAPRDDRERARQVRFLQSRGFSLSAILRFLRALPSNGDDEA